MDALYCLESDSQYGAALDCKSPMRANSQRCGIIQVGGRKAVAPALGYLSLAFANGDNLFGYPVQGAKFKVALLTSPKREAQIRKNLRGQIAQLGDCGLLKIVNSNCLASLNEKPSSKEIARCLDKVLSGVEIVIVDGYGRSNTADQQDPGFAPPGYEGGLADYFFASVPEHVSTIFVGQGCCSDAFKRWDPSISFDHVLSIYRFDKKPDPLSFLIYRERGDVDKIDGNELMVNWRVQISNGEYAWELAVGVEDADPLDEFAEFLRSLGMTYQRIGDLLGLGRSTVHRWLTSDRRVLPNKSH